MEGRESEPRCEFCRQPISREPVVSTSGTDGGELTCCSKTCSEKLETADLVFTDDGHERLFHPGIAGLDESLPQGMPRNSFSLLLGDPGTRADAILVELVWRTLERGEPAVIVAFTEPPTAVVENFLAMEWNVFPYLESGALRVVDCFTPAMDDRDRYVDRLTPWNDHVRSILEPQVRTVSDPSNIHEIGSAIDGCLESASAVETGVVVLDSLAAFGSLVQPVQAYDFVRELRAEVAKGRFVPVVAGATVAAENSEFPRDLAYAVDGVIDLGLDGSIVEDTLFRRLRVRKMRGVLAISEWHTYEFTSGLGQVTFDPREVEPGNGDAEARESEAERMSEP